jgi:hypothetical protein
MCTGRLGGLRNDTISSSPEMHRLSPSRRVGRASRPSFLFHQILQAMPARRSEPRLDRAKPEGRLGRSLALPSRRTQQRHARQVGQLAAEACRFQFGLLAPGDVKRHAAHTDGFATAKLDAATPADPTRLPPGNTTRRYRVGRRLATTLPGVVSFPEIKTKQPSFNPSVQCAINQIVTDKS